MVKSDLIDEKTVNEVAKLARLELSVEQVAEYQHQLARILAYVSQLNQLQLPPDAQPFFGVAESLNAVRADVNSPSLPRETILANAPKTDGEFYLVPPVF
jgi:aspartyl-tRNA(Asn)/glutamyl-tRNA(Gln) amidotransferase subunit C